MRKEPSASDFSLSAIFLGLFASSKVSWGRSDPKLQAGQCSEYD